MAEDSVSNEPDEKRKQFGNRFLTDSRNVFEHNAWDNVLWDEEQEKDARSKIQEQLAYLASEDDIAKFEEDANEFWNKFYGKHENKFFKDRHWLFTEFPELSPEFYLPSEKLAQLSTDSKGLGFNEDSPGNCTKVPAECLNTSTGGMSADECLGLSPEDVKQCSLNDASDRLSPRDTSVKNSTEDIVTEHLQPTYFAADQKCCRVETDNSNLVVTITSGDFSRVIECDNNQGSNMNASGENILTHDNNSCSTTCSQVCEHLGSNAKPVETFPGELAKYRIFEVGCGVGNTVFPILQANNDPYLMVYCCDYSSTAIDLVKENKDYDTRRCHAFVCDISDPAVPVPFPEGSLDVIVMIFILSANNPDKFQYILNRLASFLRPGGMILFRDYGRYDLAQLRFKKGKCLGENFYVRGDGTRVYFFTQDELRVMMTKAGLEEKQNLVDRRLQVNRGRQLKMYRVWIQCKYRKPTDIDQNLTENRNITIDNS